MRPQLSSLHQIPQLCNTGVAPPKGCRISSEHSQGANTGHRRARQHRSFGCSGLLLVTLCQAFSEAIADSQGWSCSQVPCWPASTSQTILALYCILTASSHLEAITSTGCPRAACPLPPHTRSDPISRAPPWQVGVARRLHSHRMAAHSGRGWQVLVVGPRCLTSSSTRPASDLVRSERRLIARRTYCSLTWPWAFLVYA